MRCPRVISAKAVDDHTLLIEFDNSAKKTYNITPLLENEMFFPLANAAFFKNVQIDKGGYAVFWDENIDLSEYELWTHGRTIET
jgi:hypothetical protein